MDCNNNIKLVGYVNIQNGVIVETEYSAFDWFVIPLFIPKRFDNILFVSEYRPILDPEMDKEGKKKAVSNENKGEIFYFGDNSAPNQINPNYLMTLPCLCCWYLSQD